MPRTTDAIADAARTWELVECQHEPLIVHRTSTVGSVVFIGMLLVVIYFGVAALFGDNIRALFTLSANCSVQGIAK